jgi:hypothetical protein
VYLFYKVNMQTGSIINHFIDPPCFGLGLMRVKLNMNEMFNAVYSNHDLMFPLACVVSTDLYCFHRLVL